MSLAKVFNLRTSTKPNEKKQEIQNRNDFPQNTFSNAINSFINFTMNHTRSVRKILFPSLPIIVKYASLELPNKISRKSLSNDFGIRSWPRTAACLLPLFSVTIFGSCPFKPTFHRGFWLQSIPGPKVHHVFYIVEDNSLFLNRKVAFKTYNLNELESLKRLPSWITIVLIWSKLRNLIRNKNVDRNSIKRLLIWIRLQITGISLIQLCAITHICNRAKLNHSNTQTRGWNWTFKLVTPIRVN